MSGGRSLPSGWARALSAWEADQVAEGRPASTIGRRRANLRAFVYSSGSTDPWDVTAEDLAGWLEARGFAPTTASTYRSAFRVFYAWAVATRRLNESPAAALSAVNGGAGTVVRPLGAAGPLAKPVPAVWEAAIADYARDARVAGDSPATINLRVRALGHLGRELDSGPYEVDVYELSDWLAGKRWANETRHSWRSTLRSFYGWAVEAGHMPVSPAARLPKSRRSEPSPHPADESAVHAAIAAATSRERLMVRLAAEVGLRRAEVAQVHTRDVFEDDGGHSLLVHGKGGKERVLPLPPELAAELHACPPGWVFPSRNGGHLTPHYVATRVERLLPEGVTMHALRHRFATRAYELNADVFAVQELLGHASPETTRRYVALGRARLRSTVETLAATTTRGPRQPGNGLAPSGRRGRLNARKTAR